MQKRANKTTEVTADKPGDRFLSWTQLAHMLLNYSHGSWDTQQPRAVVLVQLEDEKQESPRISMVLGLMLLQILEYNLLNRLKASRKHVNNASQFGVFERERLLTSSCGKNSRNGSI